MLSFFAPVFCIATANIPFSLYVVYKVNIPIITKYVLTQNIRIGLKKVNSNNLIPHKLYTCITLTQEMDRNSPKVKQTLQHQQQYHILTIDHP